MTIQALIARFDQDIDLLANTALGRAAEHLAEQVRQALATPPGGAHDHPWRQSGHLQDSIETHAEGNEAVIASTSDVALHQEYGTTAIPPRPTLGPLAAAEGAAIADAIAGAVVAALRGS